MLFSNHIFDCTQMPIQYLDQVLRSFLPLLPQQKAKKKPLATMNPNDLGVDIKPRLTVLSVEDPPEREAGSKVADVDELVAKLKDVGVI